MIVAQVIRISNFLLFVIWRIRQNPEIVAKIIIIDFYEDFQIFTQRKRSELEPWNFIAISLHNFENFQFFKFSNIIEKS